MRLSLRFLVPLIVTLTCLAYLVIPLADSLILRWFLRDLDTRSQLVAASLQEPLSELVPLHAEARINNVFNRVIQNERLHALAFCNPDGMLLYKTVTFPAEVNCANTGAEEVTRLPQGSVHITRSALKTENGDLGQLVLINDMGFIERRSADMRKSLIALFVVMGIFISIITLLVAHLSWRGWIAGVRAMLRGEGLLRPFASIETGTIPSGIASSAHFGAAKIDPELRPLVSDFREIFREIDDERRLRDNDALQWTPDTLKQLLRTHLSGDEIIVVSNREPYIHLQGPNGIRVQRPASGLVTAVEPVMIACSGTWIAHGSGSADQEQSDAKGRITVPPDAPAYTLRRIWMNREEEHGYYYGFSNEGMWPLCHIAHVRPVFRTSDWKYYTLINERFADAVVEEARTADPVVLVQDYHLALLPRLIRERLPQATIITFWHIPWPNPESFGICPWRKEILEGLLGSTILGFHTRSHCKNFLETADRFLETRIEHESSTITYGGKRTQIQDYPISIDWPETDTIEEQKSIEACRAMLRNRLQAGPHHLLALGVDRLDYTKGIVERFQAVEVMLESYPDLVGHFTLIQIAAPTRSALEEYQNFEAQVRGHAVRINARFPSDVPAIDLLVENHGKQSVFEHYRGSDVCVVTSLHDGMNLVAKEFVAARDDELGVLVLSQFAGAARELREALIVNPYHIEQTAQSLYRALRMSPAEQRERMLSMRSLVRDFNVYRWAGRMLLDASRQREQERMRERILSYNRPQSSHSRKRA